jgi:NAD(P)H-dependent FMN reductase
MKGRSRGALSFPQRTVPYRPLSARHANRHPRDSKEGKMLRIGIIVGSTRLGRNGGKVGEWLLELAQSRSGADYCLLDLAELNLPFLGETGAAQAAVAWQDAIGACDGFVVVAAEYNHGPGGALKNALDLCGLQWKDKAVAFAGYGGSGASRAIEMLRLIAAALGLATVKTQLAFSLGQDFDGDRFSPREHHESVAIDMLTDLTGWAGALRDLRQASIGSKAA